LHVEGKSQEKSSTRDIRGEDASSEKGKILPGWYHRKNQLHSIKYQWHQVQNHHW